MFRTRRPGVQEGNAMDEILAYQTKLERGLATPDDTMRYEASCRLLGIRSTIVTAAQPASHLDVDAQSSTPTIGMVNSADFEGYWGAIKVVGAVFLLFALCCVAVVLLTTAVNSFVSLAHP